MNDDKDDQDNHRVFHDRNAQKLHRINQRKEHYFTQASRDDEDDEYDSVFFLIGMLKICVALNKEKGFASFRHQVTIGTIRTMI